MAFISTLVRNVRVRLFEYLPQSSSPTRLQHLSKIAKDFKDDPYVIGVDLRNEVRYANGVVPQWFSGSSTADWGSAALKGGISVNMIAPDKLIVVGGLWYNMFLCDIGKLPVHEFIKNRVVYESHVYSWFSMRHIAAQIML